MKKSFKYRIFVFLLAVLLIPIIPVYAEEGGVQQNTEVLVTPTPSPTPSPSPVPKVSQEPVQQPPEQITPITQQPIEQPSQASIQQPPAEPAPVQEQPAQSIPVIDPAANQESEKTVTQDPIPQQQDNHAQTEQNFGTKISVQNENDKNKEDIKSENVNDEKTSENNSSDNNVKKEEIKEDNSEKKEKENSGDNSNEKSQKEKSETDKATDTKENGEENIEEKENKEEKKTEEKQNGEEMEEEDEKPEEPSAEYLAAVSAFESIKNSKYASMDAETLSALTQEELDELTALLENALSAYGALSDEEQMLFDTEHFELLFLAMSLQEVVFSFSTDIELLSSSGSSGKDSKWELDDDGKMEISGKGDVTKDFSNDNTIKEVVIDNGVTSIGDNIFDGCANLKTVTLPEGIETIGKEAFVGCSSLTEIDLPSTVTKIGNDAFKGLTITINYCTETAITKAKDTFGAAKITWKKIDHNTKGSVQAKTATCKENGIQGGTYCTLCNTGKEAAEKVIPAAHTAVKDAYIAPTTYTPGKTEGAHCSVCGEIITAQKIIPSLAAQNYAISNYVYWYQPYYRTTANNTYDTTVVGFDVNYVFAESADPHKTYPTDMTVSFLHGSGSKTNIQELNNLMSYKGYSVSKSEPGKVKVYTEMQKSLRNRLITTGTNGWKLIEYGTAVMGKSKYDRTNLFELGADGVTAVVSFDAKENSPDFGGKDGKIQYVSELSGFGDNEEIMFRSYSKFRNSDDKVITLYGGIVNRNTSFTNDMKQESDGWSEPVM